MYKGVINMLEYHGKVLELMGNQVVERDKQFSEYSLIERVCAYLMISSVIVVPILYIFRLF